MTTDRDALREALGKAGFCVQCGPTNHSDEDGCCITCGATVDGKAWDGLRESALALLDSAPESQPTAGRGDDEQA